MPCLRGCHGVPIHVFDPNPRSREETIVFVHSWPLNHEIFEYQYNALNDCRCIGIDLRGFGRSGAPHNNYTYDTYSDDLAMVIRQLGICNFSLVGYSMGGAVCLRYMRRHRGQGVKKLALLAATAPVFTQRLDFPYGQTRADVDALIAQASVNRPQMLEDFNKQFFSVDPGRPFREWTFMLGCNASPAGTIQSLYELRDEDLRDDASFVYAPCGIFHGRLDRFCPFELGKQLHELIPTSTLFAFEKSGHCIIHDELELFNWEFSNFVRS